MDRAGVRRDDLADDPQPQAEALGARGRAELDEALEDALPVARRDAGPVVAVVQQDVPALDPQVDLDRLPRRVLERVREQVRHDVIEALSVPASERLARSPYRHGDAGPPELLLV